MTKLKTIPNMGTRKLTLPFVGTVSMEDGVFEVKEELVKDLLSCNCGFKIKPLESSGTEEKGDQGAGVEDTGVGGEVTLESLSKLRVKDLNEIFDSLKEEKEITEGEIEDFGAMNKPEKAQFLFNLINGSEEAKDAE